VTWSVVATDSRTGEVGVAVASCVPLDVVLAVPGVAAGRGALVTQSYLLEGERDRAVGLLQDGLDPASVLAALVDPSFDPDFELRQIAIVGLDGGVASFTGRDALAFAGHASSQVDGVSVAVQGNLLTGPEVIEEALGAALDSSSCDVPARLLAALEAGGRDGRGDSRCTPLGRSSQSAMLEAGGFSIEVGVAEPGTGPDPLVTLRSRFDEARVALACPELAEPTSSSTASGGSQGGGHGGMDEPSHAATGADDGPLLALAVVALVSFRRRRRSVARRTRR
jgi:MYXO-CTERM domain-containing protein